MDPWTRHGDADFSSPTYVLFSQQLTQILTVRFLCKCLLSKYINLNNIPDCGQITLMYSNHESPKKSNNTIKSSP